MLRAVAFLLLFAPVAANAACSRPDIAAAAAAVAQARGTLAAFRIDDNDLDPSISPAKNDAIVAMKARLAALAVAYMRCARADIDPKRAQGELDALVHASMPATVNHFGQQLGVIVTRPRAGFLAVASGFNIKCANDDVTSLFTFDAGQWRERMRLQAGRYKDAGGATDGLEIQVSPGADWFVVAKSVAPWCSSTWSEIRYDVLRPTADPLAPKKLYHAKDSIWWGGEDMGRLKIGASDFELRFHAESIDPAVHNREWIRHFAVVGDDVHRLPPYANNARDFADEWIITKWDEARHWTATPTLKPIHDVIMRDKYGLEFISIRDCGADGLKQVEVQSYEDDDRNYYLLISGGGLNFVLQNAATKPDPRCKGPNLYDINKPEQ